MIVVAMAGAAAGVGAAADVVAMMVGGTVDVTCLLVTIVVKNIAFDQ